MRVLKDNIPIGLEKQALDILNKLRIGNRVFGLPAQGLKKTLKKLEENAPQVDSFDSTKFNLDDSCYYHDVSKLKAGIKGEQILAEYLEKIIRLDPLLGDMIVFASLGDENARDDYIPDSDFLCLYGNSILIIDAKNMKTPKENPIFVSGRGIYSASKDKPLIEVNSSVPVWKSKLHNYELELITGCCCIINKSGCEIFRNEEWVNSDIRPIHISDLLNFLHDFVEGREAVYDLGLLATIANEQIREEKSGLDLTYGKRILGL